MNSMNQAARAWFQGWWVGAGLPASFAGSRVVYGTFATHQSGA